MKRLFVFLFFVLPTLCWGHIGASTVVTEGSAGPYNVRVVLRPPDVIPGRAEIDVRLLDPAPGDVSVTVLPVSGLHGLKGAPTPDVAAPVRGDVALRHGELWLMTTGAYSVHVTVSGAAGSGKFIVPVDAVATHSLPMPKALGAGLAVLGLILFSGLVTLASTGARQSVTEPSQVPTPAQRRRTAFVALVTCALLCLGIIWIKRWWGYEDWVYRNKIVYNPLPLDAKAWTREGHSYLELTIAPGRTGEPEAPLVLLPDHGKLMHLFAIREPQLDAFAHLHPIQLRPGVFGLSLPALPEGNYRLYSDITYESGFAATLTALVRLPAAHSDVPAALTEPADPDDSWFIPGEQARPADGAVLESLTVPSLRAGEEVSLRFKAVARDGSAAGLQPYLGMMGHAAVRLSDGSVFAHLHPVGTISMASQEFFEAQAGLGAVNTVDPHAAHHGHNGGPAITEISFPFEFPKPGRYRVWVQAKIAGEVVTGVFDYDVAGPR